MIDGTRSVSPALGTSVLGPGTEEQVLRTENLTMRIQEPLARAGSERASERSQQRGGWRCNGVTGEVRRGVSKRWWIQLRRTKTPKRNETKTGRYERLTLPRRADNVSMQFGKDLHLVISIG